MNSDNQGWLKLYRQSLDSQVFANSDLWKVWCWCLMKASHQHQWIPMKIGMGTSEVEVQSGQFISGRKSAAKELKMKESSVNNRIQKLKSIGNIDIESNSHYSIITVLKWSEYQGLNNQNEQPNEHQENQQRTTNGQGGNTNNNVEIDNNEKNENKKELKNLFSKFYQKYPGSKRSVDTEYHDFIQINWDFETIIPKLEEKIDKFILYRNHKTDLGEFVPAHKNLANWLKTRSWEENLGETTENVKKINSLSKSIMRVRLEEIPIGTEIIANNHKFEKISETHFETQNGVLTFGDFENHFNDFTVKMDDK